MTTSAPLTGLDVVTGYPDAADAPYNLTLDAYGALVTAVADGWISATPNGDGTWLLEARRGPIGSDSTVELTAVLDAPTPIHQVFAEAAGETITLADPQAVVSGIFNFLIDVRRHFEYRDLLASIPTLTLDSAGGACPFQATGSLYGLRFYFRYRSGHASLRLGHTDDDHFDAPLYSAAEEYGDEYDGVLDNDQFAALFTRLVKGLTRAGRVWEFNGVQTNDWGNGSPGDPTTYRVFGDTPEQAFTRFAEISEWLIEKGVSAEDQREAFEARKIDPATITVDDRVWPDPEPVFTVLT